MISLAGTHLINKYGGPSLSMCPVQAIHKGINFVVMIVRYENGFCTGSAIS